MKDIVYPNLNRYCFQTLNIKHDWPGLAKEARIICQELNIEDVTLTKEGKIS